jgi:hypothetical protein
MGLRETLTLKETLEAATPGPWKIDDGFGSKIAVYGRVIDGVARTLVTEIDTSYDAPFDRAECENDAALIALAPELASLALDMGELLRGRLYHGFVPGSNGDTDAYALLARLDQLGAADETRLGKEPGDE